MSRRLILLLLVPALVGTMVGVGAATLRSPGSSDTSAPQQREAAAATPADFDLGFSRKPSGLKPMDVPEPERKRKKKKDKGEEFTYDVAEVQQQLADLKYYIGPIDGEAGGGFSAAVMAFQKVQGIGADGAVGPQTLAALKDPKRPSLKGGAATRIEVDLTKQVLYYVKDGGLLRIMPVSSGNGATYSTDGGGTARALTPVGTYAVQRKIPGTRVAPLGSLYDPMYFYQGWAIHGSNSVPAYPASHGCIRVTRADAIWLYSRVPVGMQVSIYGGTHTFTAGSSAPGTAEPAGDTAADPKPEDDAEDKPSKPEEDPKPADEPPADDKPSPKPEPEETEAPDEEPSEGDEAPSEPAEEPAEDDVPIPDEDPPARD